MSFKTCQYCSQEIPKDTNFCPYCTRPTSLRLGIWVRLHPLRFLLSCVFVAILVKGLFGGSNPSWPFSPVPALTPTTVPRITLLPTRKSVPSFTPTQSPTATPLPTLTYTPTFTPTVTPTSTLTPIVILTQISTKDNMVLVYVPAGEFRMGSSKSDDPQAGDEELPQHIVYLDAFWIDQTEVTNAQYARCVADAGACTKPKGNNSATRGSYFGNVQFANYPVLLITWSQASTYCAWAGRRLPTEAEWEKAARGPDGRIYPWGNTFNGKLANYCDINCTNTGWKDFSTDDGYVDTSPVGEYPDGASVYGALDMAGNAYEWVADWYGPYNRAGQNNPKGPASGEQHIIRGGSWGDDSGHVRTAMRSHEYVIDDYWTNYIGFRCVK